MSIITDDMSTSGRRITIYVGPEREELLRWVQEHTGAPSFSEAFFAALSELRQLVAAQQREALAAVYGLWRHAPEVDEALAELQSGWRRWRGES
ncbi:MAG TPA: hypothetical protein VNL95_04050 [Dehalococcoidia bacterium]|nr:hypothetical protein [Dehalococcoidia bacterium]